MVAHAFSLSGRGRQISAPELSLVYLHSELWASNCNIERPCLKINKNNLKKMLGYRTGKVTVLTIQA